MKAVLEDKEWHTRYVTTGEICDTYRARDIMRMIAEAAWLCGDQECNLTQRSIIGIHVQTLVE